jgi:hypothetical protein
MDIRYFFNAVRDARPEPRPEPKVEAKQETLDDFVPDEINLDDIPF